MISSISTPFMATVTAGDLETRQGRTASYLFARAVAVEPNGGRMRMTPMVADALTAAHMQADLATGRPLRVVACWCPGMLKILAPAPAGDLAAEIPLPTDDERTVWSRYRRLTMHVERTVQTWTTPVPALPMAA